MTNEGAPEHGYAVILIRSSIDRFSHNEVFASELAPALSSFGISVRILDYIEQPVEVHKAITDKRCCFFVCFNGFGSEIKLYRSPGSLMSAYTAYNKVLFDFMHDCPAHETMFHQMDSTFPNRRLIITDYQYAGIAYQLGVQSVHFHPSIGFPCAMSGPRRRIHERSIEILLPIGISSPGTAWSRHNGSGLRNRVFRTMFEEIVSACVEDWSRDPIFDLQMKLSEVGIHSNYSDPDIRFLLTTAMDAIKFGRRQRLVKALADLPVTFVTDRPAQGIPIPANAKVQPSTSFRGLLSLMGDAKCVLSPGPHITGYHERALGTLSAEAVLVSFPNRVLEANLQRGKDFVLLSGPGQLREAISSLLSDEDAMQAIATSGHDLASTKFSPQRLAATIWNLRPKQVP